MTHSSPAVSIGHDWYVIDTELWIAQRVGPADERYTTALRDFTRHPLLADTAPADLTARVVQWCLAREWTVTEGSPLHHDDTHLSHPVSVVLAITGAPEPTPTVVVIDAHQATVYPDRTTDDGLWHQPDTVDLVCPSGHRHTWLGDGELIDSNDEYTTIAALFGPGPRAPYQDCRTCRAYEQDPTWLRPCPCGGGSAIYCPRCGDRCQPRLPDIATYPTAGGLA